VSKLAEEDDSLARVYCLFKGLRYLSCERYGKKLHIAVEAPGDRYEVTIDAHDFQKSEARQ
jgi:hypothetical protein